MLRQERKEKSSNELINSLNQQELNTYNIIIATLKKQSYKDTQRQIQHFMQISNHPLKTILQQVLPLTLSIQSLQNQLQLQSKANTDLISTLSQIYKCIRNDKLDELEKVKNKAKTQMPVEITQIIQITLTLKAENKRYKKKDQHSVQRQMKSAQKQKATRSLQTQNKELLIALRNMEMKLSEMETQKLKLEQNVKRLSRQSLPPRRPEKQPQSARKADEKLKVQMQQLMRQRQQSSTLINMLKQQSKSLSSQLDSSKQQVGRLKAYIEQLNSESISVNTSNVQTQQRQYNLGQQQINQYQHALCQSKQQLQLAQQQLYNYKNIFNQSTQSVTLDKMLQLKHSYETSQLEIRKIENEVERLIQQKHSAQQKMQQLTTLKNQEIQHLSYLLNQQQNVNKQLNEEIYRLKKHSELFALNTQQERLINNNQIKNLQEQNTKLKERLELQLQEHKKKYERYGEQIAHHSNDSLTIKRAVTGQDYQKQQLRRQLQLLNQQLTNALRNYQAQRREQRKYIQEIISQSQMQSTVHNQEKRILKESIERARNEEYQINQEKIRKQREDIFTLRNQNQRLTSIIDSNQNSFNLLLRDHENIVSELQRVSQLNHSLTKSIQLSEKEKEELVQRLSSLEQKLTDFQAKIITTLEQQSSHRSISDLQRQNSTLQQQKMQLNQQISEQARELVTIHQELIRLQAQLNHQRQNRENKKGEYSCYLEEKLQETQAEINRHIQRETQLSLKVESLLKVINELESQRHLSQSKSDAINPSKQHEISKLHEKIIKLQTFINQITLKATQQQFKSQQIVNTQLKLRQLQSSKLRILQQNVYLKALLQKHSQQRSLYILQMQQSKKLDLQNKRLSNKIQTLSCQFQQVKQKYLQSERYNLMLQKALQQDNEPTIKYEVNQSVGIHQQLLWYKEKLKAKQLQITSLRQSQMLNRSINVLQHQKEQAQQKYHKQAIILQQTKLKLINLQEALHEQRANCRRQNSLLHVKQQQIHDLQLQLVRIQNSKDRQIQSHKQQNFLQKISQQFGQNNQMGENSQNTQISILHKISEQISLLISNNNKLLDKCNALERQKHDMESSLIGCLQSMVRDLITYLCARRFINPEHVPPIPQHSDGEKLIREIGLLLKDVFYDSFKCNDIN